MASYGVVSKRVIGPRPETPLTRLAQAVVDVVADGADDPETGDDDAAVVVGLAQDASSCCDGTVQAGTAARASSRSREAGSSAGDDLGVGGDALDEAGQDATRADLDEGRHAGGGHPLDGADPVDAGRQVLDELGPAGLGRLDRAGIRVGQERDGGVGEGDAGERRAHARRPPRP